MEKYHIYVIKSFKERILMHIGFIIMLTCAFILPFIFTIALDSASYGLQLQNEYITGGSDFYIENAQKDDLVHYNEINGITARYDEGKIFIDSVKKLDKESRRELSMLLFIETSNIGQDRLILIDTTFDTSVQERFFTQWIVIIIVLLTISMLIIQVAYATHIGNFKKDIGILKSIGEIGRAHV